MEEIMALPIKGLLKNLKTLLKITGKDTKGITDFEKVYKNVSSVTKKLFPIAEGVNPPVVKAGLRGKLVRTLVPKDITNMIIPKKWPGEILMEDMKKNVARFRKQYPNGLRILDDEVGIASKKISKSTKGSMFAGGAALGGAALGFAGYKRLRK